MIARIRLRRGRPLQRTRGKNRHVASAFGALLIPLALMAYVLGIWRVASDMEMVGQFPMTGIFSHWQVWIVVGVMLHLAAASFNRYGRGGDLHMPRFLNLRVFPGRTGTEAPERR